jgi:GTPase SAR1 family protein
LKKSSRREDELQKKRKTLKLEIQEKLGVMINENIEVFSTSAKTGHNIYELFLKIAEDCYAKDHGDPAKQSDRLQT